MQLQGRIGERRPVLSVLARQPFSYGVALLAVALATLASWGLLAYLAEELSLIAYYGAVLLAALAGGLGAGLLALVLSMISAAYLLPPAFAFAVETEELSSLLLSTLVSAVNVTVVVALKAAGKSMSTQEEQLRLFLESAPNAIVVVDQNGTIKLVNAATERLFGYEREERYPRPAASCRPRCGAADDRRERDPPGRSRKTAAPVPPASPSSLRPPRKSQGNGITASSTDQARLNQQNQHMRQN